MDAVCPCNLYKLMNVEKPHVIAGYTHNGLPQEAQSENVTKPKFRNMDSLGVYVEKLVTTRKKAEVFNDMKCFMVILYENTIRMHA